MTEHELWAVYLADRSDTNRNALVVHYLPLVKYHANRIFLTTPDMVEACELEQFAAIGLMQAVESFDPSKNVQFTSYCADRIRGATLDGLREEDWVPRLCRSRYAKIKQAQSDIYNETGRQPTDNELAERLGVSIEVYQKSWAAEARVAIMHGLTSIFYDVETVDGIDMIEGVEFLIDPAADLPTRELQKKALLALVTKGFNKTERLILILYYYEDLTTREIGKIVGLSGSQVSRMHSALVLRLRNKLAGREEEFAA